MSLRGSPRVNSKPDSEIKNSSVFPKQNSAKRVDGCRGKFTGTCRFRLPKRSEFLPMRYLQNLGHKVATALRMVSNRRTSRKDSSSSGRAKPFVTPVDSHRAEAIDDCIEFINSSSTLQKSNSVSR